jgi:hypothetical protein
MILSKIMKSLDIMIPVICSQNAVFKKESPLLPVNDEVRNIEDGYSIIGTEDAVYGWIPEMEFLHDGSEGRKRH